MENNLQINDNIWYSDDKTFFRTKFRLGVTIAYDEPYKLDGFLSCIYVTSKTPQEFIENWRKEDREKWEQQQKEEREYREMRYEQEEQSEIFGFCIKGLWLISVITLLLSKCYTMAAILFILIVL